MSNTTTGLVTALDQVQRRIRAAVVVGLELALMTERRHNLTGLGHFEGVLLVLLGVGTNQRDGFVAQGPVAWPYTKLGWTKLAPRPGGNLLHIDDGGQLCPFRSNTEILLLLLVHHEVALYRIQTAVVQERRRADFAII